MSYLRKHVLLCTDPSSCGPQGAERIREALKAGLKERGLRLRIREGACSCLGLCLKGVNAVVWPEGLWLAGLSETDVPRLLDYLAGRGAPLSDLEESAKGKIEAKLAESDPARCANVGTRGDDFK